MLVSTYTRKTFYDHNISNCMMQLSLQDSNSAFADISILVSGINTLASRGAIRRAWSRTGSSDVRPIVFNQLGQPLKPLPKRRMGRKPKSKVPLTLHFSCLACCSV
jgi:hypothetical protein